MTLIIYQERIPDDIGVKFIQVHTWSFLRIIAIRDSLIIVAGLFFIACYYRVFIFLFWLKKVLIPLQVL